MRAQFTLYRSAPQPCPYIPGRQWVTHAFATETIAPALYETLISQGFRRSGYIFYQNHCPGCEICCPIRVDVQRFAPTTSQRRVLRKNRDVRMTHRPVSFDDAEFRLYREYCAERHPSSSLPDEEDYVRFLIGSPVPTEIIRYTIGDQLVGLGWMDVLVHSLSSVYFAFDPKFSARSLGTFSILRQIALCRELGKPYLQLGFWVEPCQNMTYKSRFKPCQILVDGVWQTLP